MQFSSEGLPKDNGASDYADSARLAGLMVLFGHPAMEPKFLTKYLVEYWQAAVRYPNPDPYQNPSWSNNPKNFSRDQLICLTAGLKAARLPLSCGLLYLAAKERYYFCQNTEDDVPGSVKKFPNGPDILSPSHVNHLRVCSGRKPLWFGKLWLVLDIVISSKFMPLAEPNQLMAMCAVAGPWYIGFLRKMNPQLDTAIRNYWSGWRGESDFAELLIKGFV